MTITISLPAGRPKRDIIELAFDDCGMAGYEFDRTPEEQGMALRKLNAMMAEWPWSNLGYAQPSYGAGQVEGPSGIPDFAISAVAQYLALRIAPGMGASISSETRASMAHSRATLFGQIATIPDMALPGNTPRGQGERFRSSPFTPRND